jgi:hypothetical protein
MPYSFIIPENYLIMNAPKEPIQITIEGKAESEEEMM